MATCFRVILALSALLLVGCYQPGGGGTVNVPPPAAEYGQTTPVHIELSVWGAGSGKMTERYTEVRCHYKAEGATSFTALEGRVESETKDRLTLVFDLPAFSPADGKYLEYYLDMKFDGNYFKRAVERVPLR